MKKINNITLLHGINYWNIGDLGITDAMITAFSQKIPEAKITVLTPYYHWPKPKNILFEQKIIEQPDIFLFPSKNELKTITKKIKYFFFAYLNLLFLFIFGGFYFLFGLKLFFLFSLSVQSTIKQYLRSELIISKGGGFLFDHGRFILSPHAFPIVFALLLKKPIVIYAQSLGPFKRKISEKIYKYIFQRLNLIIVREKISEKILKQMDVDCILGYDAAFTLEKTKRESIIKPQIEQIKKLKQKYQYVIGLSLLVWKFPQQSNDQIENYQQKYYQSVAETIKYLKEKYSCYFYFFPHSLDSLEIDDLVAIKKVIALSNLLPEQYHIMSTSYNPRFYVEFYRQMNFCIGSRMHSNIFTLLAGTPLIAISYLPKTEGIMDLLGFKKWVIDINQITPEILIELTKKLINQLIPFSESIKKSVSQARDESFKNIDLIIDRVGQEK